MISCFAQREFQQQQLRKLRPVQLDYAGQRPNQRYVVNALSGEGLIYQIFVSPDLQNIADVRGPFQQTGVKIVQFQTVD